MLSWGSAHEEYFNLSNARSPRGGFSSWFERWEQLGWRTWFQVALHLGRFNISTKIQEHRRWISKVSSGGETGLEWRPLFRVDLLRGLLWLRPSRWLLFDSQVILISTDSLRAVTFQALVISANSGAWI